MLALPEKIGVFDFVSLGIADQMQTKAAAADRRKLMRFAPIAIKGIQHLRRNFSLRCPAKARHFFHKCFNLFFQGGDAADWQHRQRNIFLHRLLNFRSLCHHDLKPLSFFLKKLRQLAAVFLCDLRKNCDHLLIFVTRKKIKGKVFKICVTSVYV